MFTVPNDVTIQYTFDTDYLRCILLAIVVFYKQDYNNETAPLECEGGWVYVLFV